MTTRAQRMLKDAAVHDEAWALGTSDGTTQSAAIDLGPLSARGVREADIELEIVAPALNTTQLPDADTCTYSIESDDNSGFSSAAIVADKVLVQTGAGGAGAATATLRLRIPPQVERYIRVKAILAGTTGDCSGANVQTSIRF